ncbi:MAG: CIA30 family protein [Candidatus Zixiibacteriota bacterium]|nr:MAG: CIA30 family protein [candidate division Zixibacteria bacterium]
MSLKTDTTRTIFNFEDKGQIAQWISINDNVMGGESKGKASFCENNCLLFSGSISLENNGGFASVRTLPRDFELGGYKGIRIRVKGDGRAYQFRVRVDGNIDGMAFKHDLQTVENTWLDIDLPFESFLPTYRGKILKEVNPLVAGDIRQLGFLIADKKIGPFKLIVDEIVKFR